MDSGLDYRLDSGLDSGVTLIWPPLWIRHWDLCNFYVSQDLLYNKWARGWGGKYWDNPLRQCACTPIPPQAHNLEYPVSVPSHERDQESSNWLRPLAWVLIQGCCGLQNPVAFSSTLSKYAAGPTIAYLSALVATWVLILEHMELV